jgi:hypothetical protein
MPIDDRIHQITAHDTSVRSNPELTHATFHVQAIINHHQSITSCTIHNSPSFESLLLPMLSIGESVHHACHSNCGHWKTTNVWGVYDCGKMKRDNDLPK